MIFFEIGFSNNNIIGAHSHNDYKNEYPLDAAFKHKFKSIEVDIFLLRNKLYVGHSWLELRKTKTIEKGKLVAETLNGRFAMIGLIAAIGAYLTTGQIIPGFI